MSTYSIAVLAGDGIGSEVTAEALRVVDTAASLVGGLDIETEAIAASAVQWQQTGVAITDDQFDRCAAASAMYMGAIGLPEALHEDGTEVAGDVIFKLRFDLDLYAGVRPVKSYPGVPSLLAHGDDIDYIVVRENVEGLYASRGAGVNVRDEIATDTIVITRVGTEKVVRKAFALAAERAGTREFSRVTCVDKANVLASYAFFRKVFDEIGTEFPETEKERVYVDAMTLYQVQRPQSFDVVVAENMFGDIISDLSAGTVGGLGLASSGDIGDTHGLFQPAHGSAPTIAGQNIANPSAAILSGSLMLSWLGQQHDDDKAREAGRLIDVAVADALVSAENRTVDLRGTASTTDAGEAVIRRLHELSAQ
ncbi:isocitrate/isopropylmalate dehydrogenase family protein [Herbiconiux ginsengi]|uniref:3-isopropylmalate dehydrogenase n=1 Tax=Herbiconiux ginsengi TaxID=381665 RepID=A0A1H3U309_9MICO|nr:isocitrate/isopropylmalate dehydrogenase family protein [Herbiconiux ginsengi]SDZ56687.1 3-isopropylmalate dehydrogenase [Herbiconiux ginsengi]